MAKKNKHSKNITELTSVETIDIKKYLNILIKERKIFEQDDNDIKTADVKEITIPDNVCYSLAQDESFKKNGGKDALLVEHVVDDKALEDEQESFLGQKGEIGELCEKLEKKYLQLMNEHQWNEIILHAENVIQNGQASEIILSRLWWVKAQAYLNSMPISILAAPLDSATNEIINHQELYNHSLREFASEVLVFVSTKLKEVGDLELAEVFSKRADLLLQMTKKSDKQVAGLNKVKEKILTFTENDVEVSSNAVLSQVSANIAVNSKKKYFSFKFILPVLLIGIAIICYNRFEKLFYDGESEKNTYAQKINEALLLQKYSVSKMSYPELNRVVVTKMNSYNGILRHLGDTLVSDDGSGLDPVVNKDEQNHNKNADNTAAFAGKRKKEQVNMHGPIESNDLRRLIDEGMYDNILSERSDGAIDKITEPIVPMDMIKDPIVPAFMIPQHQGNTEMYLIKQMADVHLLPRTMSKKVDVVITGDRVQVTQIKRGWATIVSRSGKLGYIQEKALGNRFQDADESFHLK